jgi:carboxypeptidase Taq
MTNELVEKLNYTKTILHEAALYEHAGRVINFDLETICPSSEMEEQGEMQTFLTNKAFELYKLPQFIESCEYMYIHRSELTNQLDVILAESLHRTYLKTKNITPQMDHAYSLIYNKAFVNWINAKKNASFSLFAPSLEEVRTIEIEQIMLRENRFNERYDNLLDDYERGMTVADLDELFSSCRNRLTPLLKKIMASPLKIRTDFLSRPVTDEQQRELAQYLLKTLGFDFSRGAFTTTEHPFTDGVAHNDIRVTTHYYPNLFSSSMYSIIHECGHALFEQLQPAEDWEQYINENKTMGMHESVSRFYENRIGRSPAFISFIYPELKRILPDVLGDVSEQELYKALNIVQPSLIRTEADEFTYTFHIMIRYELEKEIINETTAIESLPQRWNDLYVSYLGVRPQNDREGILQDVHWSSGFGYFTAYALGNMYNALYYQEMNKAFSIDEAIRNGDFTKINTWMKEHIFSSADRMTPKEWIRSITGKDFSVTPFLDYLEDKYTGLYKL